MNKLASAMTGTHGEPIALSDVAISARLQDLLAEVKVTQTYRNDEKVNIEAVYTFPLPLDAVILDLHLRIGERILRGLVVEKDSAEETYEEAVESGDTAVMLQVIEPGLYTMNLGNLLAGETATITITYALLHRWNDDRLRILLPTTVAPRYGKTIHLPHQTPEHALTVENQFSLQLEILGVLSEAQLDCPTHAVKQSREPGRTVLALRQARAVMDRDFVLNLKSRHATRDYVLCGPDGDGTAAIACLQPALPGLREPRPLNIVVVIDCSGSMQGDSIAQAKQAIERIVDNLAPADRAGIVAFGSTARRLHNTLIACTEPNRARIRQFTAALAADMGGTEIATALQAAIALSGEGKSTDILLITDGEVTDWQNIVQDTKTAGARIFTVGVGSAVTEAFLRELSVSTGAACELVSPREEISARVLRQFERMRAPHSNTATLSWPHAAVQVTPQRIPATFEGDTVVSAARFDQWPADPRVTLELTSATGEVHRQHVTIPTVFEDEENPSTVARLSASLRIKELSPEEATATAVRYRLITPWTHWIVIAERADAERAPQLPVLRKVPQTLAAGWAGAGTLQVRTSRPPAHPRDLYAEVYSMPSSARRATIREFRADAMDRVSHEHSRPAPTIPLPLLNIVRRTPDRLVPEQAARLLSEANLLDHFGSTMTKAVRLGLSEEAAATLVVALLLGKHARHIAPAAAHDAIQSFLRQAQKLREQLAGLSSLSEDIHRARLGTGDFRVLAPELRASLHDSGHALSRLPDILDELEDAVKSFSRRSLSDLLEDDMI